MKNEELAEVLATMTIADRDYRIATKQDLRRIFVKVLEEVALQDITRYGNKFPVNSEFKLS